MPLRHPFAILLFYILVGFLTLFTFFVPQEVIGDGKHIIVQFVYDSSDVGQSADSRSLTLALDWIRFAAGR